MNRMTRSNHPALLHADALDLGPSACVASRPRPTSGGWFHAAGVRTVRFERVDTTSANGQFDRAFDLLAPLVDACDDSPRLLVRSTLTSSAHGPWIDRLADHLRARVERLSAAREIVLVREAMHRSIGAPTGPHALLALDDDAARVALVTRDEVLAHACAPDTTTLAGTARELIADAHPTTITPLLVGGSSVRSLLERLRPERGSHSADRGGAHPTTLADLRATAEADDTAASVRHTASLVADVAEALGAATILIGEAGLAEGIALAAVDLVGTQTPPPSEVRAGAVVDLLVQQAADVSAGERTARLANQLFRDSRRLHGLTEPDREALGHAARLHALCGDRVGHGPIAALTVSQAGLRGFTPQRVAMVAALLRGADGSTPDVMHGPFARLSPRGRTTTWWLLALLRVARVLASDEVAAIRRASLELEPNRVELVLFGDDPDHVLDALAEPLAAFEQATGTPMGARAGNDAPRPQRPLPAFEV